MEQDQDPQNQRLVQIFLFDVLQLNLTFFLCSIAFYQTNAITETCSRAEGRGCTAVSGPGN